MSIGDDDNINILYILTYAWTSRSRLFTCLIHFYDWQIERSIYQRSPIVYIRKYSQKKGEGDTYSYLLNVSNYYYYYYCTRIYGQCANCMLSPTSTNGSSSPSHCASINIYVLYVICVYTVYIRYWWWRWLATKSFDDFNVTSSSWHVIILHKLVYIRVLYKQQYMASILLSLLLS